MRPQSRCVTRQRAMWFQYRKMVSPHAALSKVWSYPLVVSKFQYRKRVSPHAAAKWLISHMADRGRFNTAKGSPPMRLVKSDKAGKKVTGFNTAKGSPPMRR